MTCIDEIREYLDTRIVNTIYFIAHVRRYGDRPWFGPSPESDYVRYALNSLWEEL